MANFIQAFQKTIRNEGGYVNDPDDPGGETYKGISRKNWPLWLGWHIIDLLKQKPNFQASVDEHAEIREEVGIFYLNNFWNKLRGDDIRHQAVAESIFDFAVNAGIEPASVLAQNVVGAKADGVIGERTLIMINAMDPDYFMKSYTIAKIARYITICNKRPVSKKYFFGWVTRAIGVLFLLFSAGIASAQSYVKVADRAEYTKYLDYCNTPVDRDFYVEAKVSVMKINGQYSDSVGTYFVSKTPSFVLVRKGTVPVYQPNQKMVFLKCTLPVQRRKPSVADFYRFWKTNFIQEGMIDERSGISLN